MIMNVQKLRNIIIAYNQTADIYARKICKKHMQHMFGLSEYSGGQTVMRIISSSSFQIYHFFYGILYDLSRNRAFMAFL